MVDGYGMQKLRRKARGYVVSESGVHCLRLNVITFCRKFSTHVTVALYV